MKDMLRAFIVQLLYQDDSIITHLRQRILSEDPSHIEDLIHLKLTFLDVLLAQKRCYMVIDGLDESEPTTQRTILQWLNEALIPESVATGVSVKLLVSGQRNGILDQKLNCPNIRLDDTEPHLRDISQYSSAMATKIKERFGTERTAELAREVTEASKGKLKASTP